MSSSLLAQPNRKALIVAINEYPTCPLHGCIHDGNQDAQEAEQNYGFDGTNVRLLFDERATTSAIIERLNWLCYGAMPGDLLFFAYSGHGARVPSRDSEGETSGLLDCICPYDFDWQPYHMITDKLFVQIFSKLPKGVKLFWISDSCHSGGLSRELNPSGRIDTPKAFKMPDDVAWSIAAAMKAGHVSRHIKEFVNGELEVAFVPGCKSEQTSADSFIDGVSRGALTTYFWEAVHALPKDATVERIVDYTRTALADDSYTQEPVAHGTLIKGPWLQ